MNRAIVKVAFLALLSLCALPFPSSVALGESNNSAGPVIEQLELRIRSLEDQVNRLQAQVEAQKEMLSVSQSLHERAETNLVQSQAVQLSQIEATYNTTVERIQLLFGWFMGLFTLLGLVTWWLGLPALQKHLEERLFTALKPHAEEVVSKSITGWDKQVRDLVVKYETHFAAKYREYSDLRG